MIRASFQWPPSEDGSGLRHIRPSPQNVARKHRLGYSATPAALTLALRCRDPSHSAATPGLAPRPLSPGHASSPVLAVLLHPLPLRSVLQARPGQPTPPHHPDSSRATLHTLDRKSVV